MSACPANSDTFHSCLQLLGLALTAGLPKYPQSLLGGSLPSGSIDMALAFLVFSGWISVFNPLKVLLLAGHLRTAEILLRQLGMIPRIFG